MVRARRQGRRHDGEAKKLYVVVVEPDPLSRTALVGLFAGTQFLVRGAEQVEEIAVAGQRSPDFVLLSAPPELSGLGPAIRNARRLAPGSTVIVLATPTTTHDPVLAFRAGAGGYVIKEAEMNWLPAMLARHLKDGSPPLSRGVAELLVAELDDTLVPASTAAPSARELEVLLLVGGGLTNREIAEALAVSISTVKTHIHSLLAKLHLANRVQLALHAQPGIASDDPRGATS